MPSRYKLCSFKTCPWVQRAAIVLQEKKIPYDIESYPLLKAWRDTLLEARAVKASTVPEIEQEWQGNLHARNRWLGKFAPKNTAAA